MERMVEAVPNSDDQSLQHFISNSPWDETALLNKLASDADSILGNDEDSCLIIDESGFKKAGQKSVGVSRQWLGRLGKVDNGQVGVFMALNRREKVTLTDTRLFLPESWTKSKKRMEQAGVPQFRYSFSKKTELALDMIESAIERGSSHQWIGADAFYGNDPWFLRQLNQMGETFMIDIHSNQRVYLDDPRPYIPQRNSNKGRKPSLLKTDLKAIQVSTLAKKENAEAWKKVITRDSAKGIIEVEVLQKRVWLWDGKEEKAHQWHLFIKREGDSKNTLKYSLSNASENTRVERLAFMQGQRFFVERAFEDAKSSCGMAEYQVRGWIGWHHHMAMVMLVMLFMLKVKIKYDDSCELISSNDVRELLYHFLPKRVITKNEVLRQMAIRHRKRKKASEYIKNKNLKT
ncbi:MAG: IS701 family transposase [Candidatus Omnitrophica bacterium]|nr:IS701 family transposase [Candidatus Omnitrophota bacterium]